MSEPDFIAQAVPRIADVLAESARHAHHDRSRKAVRRPPPHGSTIVQLLGSRVRVLAELNLRDRHQTAERHTDSAADNPLFRKARIKHALLTKLPLQPF